MTLPIAGPARGCSPRPDLHLEIAPGSLDLTAEEWERLACQLLASRLPDRGVHEALESLREIAEFHSGQPQSIQPQAPSQPIRTRIAGSYTSITPPFDEE